MTVVTIELRDMAFGGDAVGFFEGRAVFVPMAIPGETVRVRLRQERKRMARGELLEVVVPSPQRVVPLCKHFGVCGGCQWQHIAYPVQLEFKREIVASQLRRIGRQPEPLVHPMVGMDEPWAYRNHAQLSVGPQGQLGHQALRSHEVVEIEECWIIDPLLGELWNALDLEMMEDLQRISLRAGVATQEQLILFEGDALPEWEVDAPVSCVFQLPDGAIVVMAGSDHFHEELQSRRFRISGPAFFQVNTIQAEHMMENVRRLLRPEPHEVLLDAYCGVGAFALSLAGDVRRVVGIEESPWAIADARANLHEGEPVGFIEGAVEDVLPELDVRFDAVVLDPPRAGCAPGVPEAIARCEPSRIVYVSCDPATLARDVARFAELGYALREVQPIDMFPQTYHVETVSLLRRE